MRDIVGRVNSLRGGGGVFKVQGSWKVGARGSRRRSSLEAELFVNLYVNFDV